VRLLALRHCASLGWWWRWLWRSRWNVDWQGEPKSSEKTFPSATFVHHKIPHDQTRVWTRAAAVGSQRLTAWAMARPLHQCITTMPVGWHSICGLHNNSVRLYKVPREDRSVFGEVTVSAIQNKKLDRYTCVLFRKVSEIQLFYSAVPKLLINRYYIR
jgi:hypothetical protein